MQPVAASAKPSNQDSHTNRVLEAAKFDPFGRDSERVGYMHKFTIHELRRYFANKADGK
jgi:hypothetical protein